MRPDQASRAFLASIGLALLLGVYVICGGVGSVLLPLIWASVERHGISALKGGAGWLWPAVVFLALAAVGLFLGTRTLARQAIASRKLAERVRALSLPAPDELRSIATEVGLSGRVVLVDAPEWFSFVYGAVTPRVVVSAGMLEGASGAELRAVLEHERYHVNNLDPLRVMLINVLLASSFFMPLLASLRSRYVAARELAADRRAIDAHGKRPLTAALLKTVRGPDWRELRLAAAIGGSELLDMRVRQLETGRQPPLAPLGVAHSAISFAGIAVFALAFVASVAGFGGPAAVRQATGTAVSGLALLEGLYCSVPFAIAGVFAFWMVARRARRPLDERPAD